MFKHLIQSLMLWQNSASIAALESNMFMDRIKSLILWQNSVNEATRVKYVQTPDPIFNVMTIQYQYGTLESNMFNHRIQCLLCWQNSVNKVNIGSGVWTYLTMVALLTLFCHKVKDWIRWLNIFDSMAAILTLFCHNIKDWIPCLNIFDYGGLIDPVLP